MFLGVGGVNMREAQIDSKNTKKTGKLQLVGGG